MIEFCPHCRSALLPKRRNDSVIYVCSKCGYLSDVSRRVVTTLDRPERAVFVVEKRVQTRTRPKEEYWST